MTDLYNSDFIKFVTDHAGDDPMRLRLRHSGERPQWLEAALDHLDCMSRRGRKFICDGIDYTPDVFPSRLSLEQASSARVAMFNASLVPVGSRVLDMTCGLGIDAAMLARRDCRVTAVELNPLHAAAARYNLRLFNNVTVIEGDSVSYLASCKDRRFDVIFADPARRDDADTRLYNLHHCHPDLIEIMPLIASCSPRLVAKLSPMLDISRTLLDLPGTTALYVVEDNGECKELLADVMTDNTATPLSQTDIPVSIIGRTIFTFTQADETAATASYGLPVTGDILYEPSAAAMKAGPFKLLATRFGLKTLSANTHIYFGSNQVSGFPGNAYSIIAVLPYSSSIIKRFTRTYPTVTEVAVRNFGISAEALRVKLRVPTRLPKGSDADPESPARVIGVTDSTGQPYLTVTARIRQTGG